MPAQAGGCRGRRGADGLWHVAGRFPVRLNGNPAIAERAGQQQVALTKCSATMCCTPWLDCSLPRLEQDGFEQDASLAFGEGLPDHDVGGTGLVLDRLVRLAVPGVGAR